MGGKSAHCRLERKLNKKIEIRGTVRIESGGHYEAKL